ncbi:probable calcium-binding protein CML35 [Punica granatum]|uniref:EF-hand domain-containing protein n=2 Tax=Punica granatum TaxID=22663 RepID=A0A218X2I6_PUNGR|nr:probable calcium-binding protein CML35 [Punica granatum]OWM78916.1 hypothetical protein CDL15_Pgr003087 [Punica granatum]PKI32611.1 hypothetical protein CRG98_047008 [Punica granatum]
MCQTFTLKNVALSPIPQRKLPRSCPASASPPLHLCPPATSPPTIPDPILSLFSISPDPSLFRCSAGASTIAAMKLIRKLSPKRLFVSKKALSKSDLPSFSSGSTSSTSSEASSSVHKRRVPESTTPVSVLPGEWSDTDMNFELFRLRSSKSIDREGYGVVSRAELEALLSRLGAEPPASRDEAALMLREAGCSDAESCLSMDDLLGRVGPAGGPVCDSELRETFDFFDADHDGRITAEELLGVFTTVLGDEQCTLEDCRRMIAEVDRKRDGFVCFEDFTRMMDLQI